MILTKSSNDPQELKSGPISKDTKKGFSKSENKVHKIIPKKQKPHDLF